MLTAWGHKEIKETIQELGILCRALSALNSPVWLVKKPDDSWQMIVDH